MSLLMTGFNQSSALRQGSRGAAVSQVQEMLQWLHNNDCGGNDHSAIVKYYERITGTEVRKQS